MFSKFFSWLGSVLGRYLQFSFNCAYKIWSATTGSEFPISRIFGWSCFAGCLGYIFTLFRHGFGPLWTLLQGVLDDPAFVGSLQSFDTGAFGSLDWIWAAASSYIPEALRFFLWFFGFDWWLWLGISYVGFRIAGWFLDQFSEYLGAIIERVCQLL